MSQTMTAKPIKVVMLPRISLVSFFMGGLVTVGWLLLVAYLSLTSATIALLLPPDKHQSTHQAT